MTKPKAKVNTVDKQAVKVERLAERLPALIGKDDPALMKLVKKG